jgi:hypothetical protein
VTAGVEFQDVRETVDVREGGAGHLDDIART